MRYNDIYHALKQQKANDDSSFIINVSRNEGSPSVMKFMERVQYYIDSDTYKVD